MSKYIKKYQKLSKNIKTYQNNIKTYQKTSKLKFLKKSIFLKSSYIVLDKSPQVFSHAESIFKDPGTPGTVK